MQCNQSFCGNGFSNGPYYNFHNAPLQQFSQNIYPEIVGEGEVTSVTLPDGTIQFFFMPTVKWRSPALASQCHPNIPHPMYGNTNCNNIPQYCNNNVGTWFVRSISHSSPQNNMYNLPYQQNEVQIQRHYNSDYNMNNNNGFQLKFHNDSWTSTTDLQYFFPRCHQRDYFFKQPSKSTATEQNITCHCHEVVCTKPCKCIVGPEPMSLVSLVESKTNNKYNTGSSDDCYCEEVSKKPHKRTEEKNKRKTPKTACACESTDRIVTRKKSVTTFKDKGSGSTKTACACESKDSVTRNKSVTTYTDKGSDSTKTACACESTDRIVTLNKSVTTYTDIGSGSIPTDGRETQTSDCEIETGKPEPCCEKSILLSNVLQRCEVKEAEMWRPITPMSKKAMKTISSENLKTGNVMRNCGNKQPITQTNKIAMETKWLNHSIDVSDLDSNDVLVPAAVTAKNGFQYE